MYTHIVLWKLKETAHGLTKAELSKKVQEKLELLPKQIEQIKHYEIGENIGEYQASFFDISLVSTFDNEQDFQVYCQNSKHDEVVSYIQSAIEQEQIVDYHA